MATKTQKPRKEKHQYLVWGEAPGFTPVGVFEYVWAYTRAQAVKLVRIRLENKYPTIRIYLGDCTAVRRDRPSPNPKQEPPALEVSANETVGTAASQGRLLL